MNIELNLQLARLLWPEMEIITHIGPGYDGVETHWKGALTNGHCQRIPDLSSTYEGMGMVLERMREKGYLAELKVGRELSAAGFRRYVGTLDLETASTLPEAVALAVVKVLEAR